MCGENGLVRFRLACIGGSSPRVRGKPTLRTASSLPTGLIPACAGKTVGVATSVDKRWAHPRVCGENSRFGTEHQGVQGSSPRVRGKLAAYNAGIGNIRLIPACAGKTTPTSGKYSGNMAHPRVCGENSHPPRAASG